MSRSPDQASEGRFIRRWVWVVRLLFGVATLVFFRSYLSGSWPASAAPVALVAMGGLLVLWFALDAKARRPGKADTTH